MSLVPLVAMARMVCLAQRVHVVTGAHKVFVVWLAPLDLRVSRARRARRAAQVPAVSRVFKVLRVTLATVGRKVPVVVVRQVLKGLKVSRARREREAPQVLGLVVQQVPWAPKASVARWGSRAPRVILDQLGPKVSLAEMVSRETKVPLARWAALGCVVQRVTEEFRDPRETPGC